MTLGTHKRLILAGAAAVLVVGAGVVIMIRSGGPGGGTPWSTAAQREAAEAKLRGIVPDVHFVAMQLEDAIDTLAALGGVDITVDRPALQRAGVDLALPVDLRLRNVSVDQALATLIAYAGSARSRELTFTLNGDAIVVTTTDALAPHNYAVIYDIQDISFAVFTLAAVDYSTIKNNGTGLFLDRHEDGLITRREMDEEFAFVVQSNICPDGWADAGGGAGSMHALDGRLLIVADWLRHREIERLLADVRATERD